MEERKMGDRAAYIVQNPDTELFEAIVPQATRRQGDRVVKQSVQGGVVFREDRS